MMHELFSSGDVLRGIPFDQKTKGLTLLSIELPQVSVARECNRLAPSYRGFQIFIARFENEFILLEMGEFFTQLVINLMKVSDIVGRVMNLFRTEWPLKPLIILVIFRQSLPAYLRNQIRKPYLVFWTYQTPCNLSVKNLLGPLTP